MVCIEMGVNSAVVDYNEGSTGMFSILEMFDISPGRCSIILSAKRSSVSVKNVVIRVKKRRKQLRKVKKDIIDGEKDVEKGDSCVPGGF